MLVYLLLMAHLLWGLALLAFAPRDVRNLGWQRSTTLFTLLALFALFVLALPLAKLGSQVTFGLLLKPRYERVVDRARSGPALPGEINEGVLGGEVDGLQYTYHVGRPDLVAFTWTTGIPDGGVAIVFDASDSLSKVTRPGMNVPIVPRLQGLVGEQPQKCWRLTGQYYRCSYD